MREIWRYMQGVWKFWQVLVAGLGIPLLLTQLPLVVAHLPHAFYWIVSFLTLFVAFFLAWRTEHRLRTRLQRRLIVTALRAKIATMGIVNVAALAQDAWCSQEEVMPVIEDLVRDGWLTPNGGDTWRYSASATFTWPLP